MFDRSTLRRTRQAALASALFLALVAPASADPWHHGGMHGPGGAFAGAGAPIEQAIAQVRDKLSLDTSQQAMFDNALAQTKAAREAGRSEMIRVHDAMKAELAKPEPDLAALAAIADDARAKGQAQRAQVRGEWLKLYATFSAAQKQVVRDYLLARIARGEAHRERMKERWGAKG